MDNYLGQRIAVLGYQIEGQSLVSFLIHRGANDLTVFDEKPVVLTSDHSASGVKLEITSLDEANFDNFDLIFHSPGIKPSRIKADPSKISSLINVFFEYKKGTVIGITGTKGKSTTALLVKKLLEQNDKKVFLAGNIGQSPLDFVAELEDDSYTILELSSFQLQDFKYAPEFAVILPLFPDHLDYHHDEKEYYEAKEKIFSNFEKTRLVIFEDDLEKISIHSFSNPKLVYGYSELADCRLSNDELWCEGNKLASGLSEFCARNQVPLIDAVAAGTLAKMMGFDIELDQFSDFKKLPLRVEYIGEREGVKFYNDSASTNPISTAAAMALMDRPFALIVGGASKNLPLEPLLKEVEQSNLLKRIYVIGRDKENVSATLKDVFEGEVVVAATLADVFNELKIDDVGAVLFSPAFASFDQYRNYKERGEDFNKLFKDSCRNI